MSVPLSAFLSLTMSDNKPVYVIQGTNRHKACYHDGPEACREARKADALEKTTLEKAKIRELKQCQFCAGDVDFSGADFGHQRILKQKAEEYAAQAGD